MYSWSVEGAYNKPSNADKLEAYLIELGAPVNGEGKLHRALKKFSGNSETDATANAKADFEAMMARIDYQKLKDMGLSMEHTFAYSVSDLHNNVVAEWHYPNEHSLVDTKVVESLLTIKMRFPKDLAAYCDVQVLLNGETAYTFTTEDSVLEKTYRVDTYPQDAVFASHIVLKEGIDTPADNEAVRVGCAYTYLLTNRNAAGEIVSSSSVSDATIETQWHYLTIPGRKLSEWLQRYGNAEILRFHIDGKTTEKESVY